MLDQLYGNELFAREDIWYLNFDKWKCNWITRSLIRNTVLGIDRLFADALHFSVCVFVRFSVSLPSFYTITLIELIFVVIVKRSHIFLFFSSLFLAGTICYEACICKVLCKCLFKRAIEVEHLWKTIRILLFFIFRALLPFVAFT